VDTLEGHEENWEKTIFYATKITGYTRDTLLRMFYQRFFETLKEAKSLAERQNKGK
jgi:hypothetical protein